MIGWMMAAGLVGGAVAGAAGLLRAALRHGHLLVLRGPDGAPRLYERGPEGRYAPIPAVRLPAALRRFTCGVPRPVRVRADR